MGSYTLQGDELNAEAILDFNEWLGSLAVRGNSDIILKDTGADSSALVDGPCWTLRYCLVA